MKRTGIILTAILLALIAAWFEPTGVVRGALRGEPFFSGRPASVWAARLADSNPQVVAESWRSLKNGGPNAAPVLMALIENGGSSWSDAPVRITAIKMLQERGASAAAAPVLIAALNDSDPTIRSAAAEAVGVVAPGDPAALAVLIGMLDDADNRSAIRGLAQFGPSAGAAAARLIPLLQSPVADIRWNAARTLGKVRANSAIGPLIALLKDPDDAVREHAAEALGDIGAAAASAVEPLIATLKDPYVKARRDAARALGQIGPAAKPALPQLKAISKDDPEEMVRRAAAAAIRAIGG